MLSRRSPPLLSRSCPGERRSLYNGLAKLQFNLGRGQSLTLSYLGSPELRDEYAGYRDNLDSNRISSTLQLHDVSARYIGRFLESRLQLDVMYGLHYQETRSLPQVVDRLTPKGQIPHGDIHGMGGDLGSLLGGLLSAGRS